MEVGQWNLTSTPFRGFKVLQINSKALPTDESKENLKNRLLLLSHQLARKNIPAYCLNKSPEYSEKQSDDPIIIVFDLYKHAEEFEFPDWAEITSWIPTIDKNIRYSFLDDLQKAINLATAYKLSDLDPVYFWNFLYFEIPDTPCNNYIYQNIPVYSQDEIYIRMFVSSQPTSYLSRHARIRPKTLVLIPPYVHPFYVQSISSHQATLVSITKKIIHLPFENQTFITLTKWPSSIFRFAKAGPAEVEIEKKIEQTDYQTDFYEGADEGIEQFFANNFGDVEEPPQVLPQEFVAFPTMNAYQLIDEMIENTEERKSLKKILEINPIFPKLIDKLLLPRIPFISPLSTDTSIPVASRTLGPVPNTLSSIEGGFHLGIPNCTVLQNGHTIQVPANTCYSQWTENCYLPISGPLKTKYAVYVIGQVTKEIEIFFKELESYYSLLRLGELTPLQNCIETTAENTLNGKIKQRFETEFNSEQPTVFIVHPIVFGCNIDAHVITTPIMESDIVDHSSDYMMNLALLVYTRLRELRSEPYGGLNFGNEEFTSLFFGFKFSTPISFERSAPDAPVHLHVAWDPDTKLSSWCDDTCQFFHANKAMDIDMLRKTFAKIREQLSGTSVSIILSVVAEGISEQLYNDIMAEDFLNVNDFKLVTVFPAPGVQAFFNEPFDDDIIIKSSHERCFDVPVGGFIPPLATCFVLPYSLTPYTVSIFSHQSDDDWNALVNVTRELSAMSWTAACFGKEKRISALPIHVRSLLRRARKPTLTVSRFEFLPPRSE